MTVTHWTCNLHGVRGSLGDGSLDAHQDAEHGGNQITVMFDRGSICECDEPRCNHPRGEQLSLDRPPAAT